MNPEAQQLFDEITAKDANCLTDSDILFLKARSPYMSRELKKKYAAQLGETIAVEEKPEPDVAKERAEWSEHPADKQIEDDDDDE